VRLEPVSLELLAELCGISSDELAERLPKPRLGVIRRAM
jgi:hypothetical protein